MNWTLRDIAMQLGIDASGITDAAIHHVSIDTRTLQSGDLFIALQGDQFNGHTFLEKAFEQGASGAIVNTIPESVQSNQNQCIQVPDTLQAMQTLAKKYRQQFSIPVIAITGSNGKTTTKEITAAVLQTKLRVEKSPGNLNNHIGVPLSILKWKPETEVAIVEMGANHIGEIHDLCEIAQPTHGVVTNIGKGHLGLFGSLEGVAKAKGELIDFIRKNKGMAVLNGDDPYLKPLCDRIQFCQKFGESESCDVRANDVQPNDLGCYSMKVSEQRIQLQVPGRHMIYSALAAFAIGRTLDIPAAEIKKALESFLPFKQRMEIERLGDVILINDTYNANPSSILAALQTLKELPDLKRRIAVLGDMLELGEYAIEEHRAIGQTAAEMGVELLLGFGPEMRQGVEASKTFGAEAIHFETQTDLIDHLSSILQFGDGVLVKGSRGMRMERVVDGIKKKMHHLETE